MATSGSVNFSVNRDDIIRAALLDGHVLEEDELPSSDQLSNCSQVLNMIVKQWQGRADFAPGLKVWSRVRATLFVQKDQYEYLLGTSSSADHCTASYTETTSGASIAASGTSLTVASITGISDGDNIGITMDSNTVHWDIVSGAPTGTTVTLTTGMAAVAGSGARVIAYTTKANRPLNMLTVRWKDDNGDEYPLDAWVLNQYDASPDKDQEGDATAYLYESLLPDGKLYLDAAPVDSDDRIEMTFLTPIEDFDSAADTPDYPQQWYRALKFQLTLDVADRYRIEVTQNMKNNRDEALQIAQNWDAEEVVMYFEPGLDYGESSL